MDLPSDVLVGVFEYLLAADLGAARASCTAVAPELICRACEQILERRYQFKGRLPADAMDEPGRVILAVRTAELRFICKLLCGPEPVNNASQVVSPPPTLPRRLFLEDDVESVASEVSAPDSAAASTPEFSAIASPRSSEADAALSQRAPMGMAGAGAGATPQRGQFFPTAGMATPGADEEAPAAFWVSKNWIKNFLKYAERHEQRSRALAAAAKKAKNLAKHSRKTPKSKGRRGSGGSGSDRITRKERLRDRRSSEVESPWDDVNADIRCRHGNLAVKSSGRARRRAVAPDAWTKICQYFPDSAKSEFNTEESECGHCRAQQERTGSGDCDRATMLTLMHRMYEIQSETMSALLHRKKGFPATAQRRQRSVGSGPQSRCPLQPGKYAVLPRSWMLAWRKYLRDPRSPKPEPFELHESPFMCAAHSKVLPPPNLTMFLRGETRTPLSCGSRGSGDSEEAVPGTFPCEILGEEEFAELNEWYPAAAVPTFQVENGSWLWVGTVGVCRCCRPGYTSTMADSQREVDLMTSRMRRSRGRSVYSEL